MGADAGDIAITFDKMVDTVLGLAAADVALNGAGSGDRHFQYTDAIANAEDQMTFTIDGTDYVLNTTAADTSWLLGMRSMPMRR